MFSSVPVWNQLVEACTGGLPDVNPFTYFDDGLLDTLRVINFLKAQCIEAVGYKRRTEETYTLFRTLSSSVDSKLLPLQNFTSFLLAFS